MTDPPPTSAPNEDSSTRESGSSGVGPARPALNPFDALRAARDRPPPASAEDDARRRDQPDESVGGDTTPAGVEHDPAGAGPEPGGADAGEHPEERNLRRAEIAEARARRARAKAELAIARAQEAEALARIRIAELAVSQPGPTSPARAVAPDLVAPDLVAPDLVAPDLVAPGLDPLGPPAQPDTAVVAAELAGPTVDRAGPHRTGPGPAEAAAPVPDAVGPGPDANAAAVPDAVEEAPVGRRVDATRPVLVLSLVLALLASVFAAYSAVAWASTSISQPFGKADNGGSTATTRARDAALIAARQDIAVLNSLDYRNPAQTLKNWLDASTGDLHSQFASATSGNTSSIAAAKDVARGSVLAAAVLQVNPGSGTASVIASVQIVVTPVTGAPTTKRQRIAATMTRVNGSWKLSDIGYVNISLS